MLSENSSSQFKAQIIELARKDASAGLMYATLPLSPLKGVDGDCEQAERIRREKLLQLASDILDRLAMVPETYHAQAWEQIEETFNYLMNRSEAAWWITFSQMPAYNLFWLMYYLK